MRVIARRRLLPIAIVFCAWVFLVSVSCHSALAVDRKSPPAGLRVFYTGHSFHMFVPRRVEQLVEAANIQKHKLVGTQGIGGSRVHQHWDLAVERNKAKRALTTGESALNVRTC